MKAAAINDFREAARRRLPHFLFEYIDGGSYAETTLGRNIKDLQDISLRQQVLRDVSSIDLSTTLFGQTYALPAGLAPVGLAGMNARRGEVQAIRAAQGAGAPFCLSTVSVCAIEEVRAASVAPFWFQLYVMRDRGFMRDLLARAKAAGCTTLIFTVDLPVTGARYRDVRSGLAAKPTIGGRLHRAAQIAARPGWAFDVGLFGGPHSLGNIVAAMGPGKSDLQNFLGFINANFDPSITWNDLAFIREAWDGQLILKGVLEANDAREAAKLGADGIVVSNHGGRQLDGALSSARALPSIADAVGDDLTILADGGVRSGLDVVRMLALGARGVLLGRAWAFALAAEGEAGVSRMLGLIAAEMKVAMALTGVTRIDQITRSLLAD